jgi:hypothetical protein
VSLLLLLSVEGGDGDSYKAAFLVGRIQSADVASAMQTSPAKRLKAKKGVTAVIERRSIIMVVVY